MHGRTKRKDGDAPPRLQGCFTSLTGARDKVYTFVKLLHLQQMYTVYCVYADFIYKAWENWGMRASVDSGDLWNWEYSHAYYS